MVFVLPFHVIHETCRSNDVGRSAFFMCALDYAGQKRKCTQRSEKRAGEKKMYFSFFIYTTLWDDAKR